jgi:hypothetical protein
MMMRLSLAICLLVFGCPVSHAQEWVSRPARIPGDSFRPATDAETAAIATAICDGTAKEDHCDTCPHGDQPDSGYSVSNVVFGHFVTPEGNDALVTVMGCEQKHGTVGWGFLVTKREGKWTQLDEMLGLTLDHCHAMRFRTGRQLLVCEDYSLDQYESIHSVSALFVKGESISFRNLLAASDTTIQCLEQTNPHRAQIDSVEFRDLNGDGIEDVVLTAAYGSLPDSPRRRKLCDAATDNPKIGLPAPKVMKTYRIEYLFDGRNFKAAPASEAALKIFADPDR